MARGDGDAGGVGPSMRGDGDARGGGGAESGGGSSTRRPSFLGAAEWGWRFLGAAEREWHTGMAMRAGSDLPCAGMAMRGASGAQREGARERERATAGITVHQNVCVRLHYCVIE
jgi:hypothetical protein